ncbi:DegV family protein [Halanaerobacter jeridensis]|uniref:DegV family protein with EDD domain n=1 Tax=Halanaerobacter jeridensis TaxID=706427 RepID=A0A938XP19_9FIRM|nr:DegV family protein [Halanaerobacter jeridensis]MBM7556453.1 DegV family protein with EDD domain [Halanaerobacter jeridensis]
MTNKTAILTDSTCDLSPGKLTELPIEILPLKVIYSDKEYQDRVDIEPEDIYEQFETEIPKTSMPSPEEVKQALLKLKEKGFNNVIAIHISSGLSGTYNLVQMVSKQVDDLNVEVIDSKSLSMGLGRLVLYASELIQEGLTFDELVNKVKAKVDSIEVFFVVKTLKYLKEGGRIGKVKGTIGELLNIKPIISINAVGEYYTYDKTRGRKRSINKLYNIAKSKIKEGLSKVDIMHSGSIDEAENLVNKFKSLSNVKDTFLGQLGPAMIVHAGPGLIGVAITPE